jgi:hypothetical protein
MTSRHYIRKIEYSKCLFVGDGTTAENLALPRVFGYLGSWDLIIPWVFAASDLVIFPQVAD